MKQIIIPFLLSLGLLSCKKYLDETPDKKLVVPYTLADLQALLDYPSVMMQDPTSDEASADNYYLTTATFLSFSEEGHRRKYTWQPDYIFEVNGVGNDWFDAYRKVYYCNVVLDHVESTGLTPQTQATRNDVKGQALLVRARCFLQLANVFAPAYDAATASTDMGIPLRLNADFTETSVRASVEQTYGQVLNDLKTAVTLLPKKGLHVYRASGTAAYGLLARTYLAMRNYQMAGLYADSCLQLSPALLNYNSLNAAATYPVPQFNTEVILYNASNSVPLLQSNAKVDSVLYNSYAANDCRKTVFFRDNGNGTYAFKGSYDGATGNLFSGIATDEMYLTRAECYARAGNKTAALTDLNTLLQMRMKTGTFVAVTSADAVEALAKILTERRKELVMRFVRWMDIKRLNKENAGITLKRVVNNQTYTLAPNDLRYALPIPEYIINITGMAQNPR